MNQSIQRSLDGLAPPGADSLPVWCVRAGLPAHLTAAQAAFVIASGFTGAAGQVVLVPAPDGIAGAVVGLGEDRSLWAHGGLAHALPEGVWRLEPGDFDAGQAALGWLLGAYRYAVFTPAKRAPALVTTDDALVIAIARATALARDLVNAPANVLGPAELAAATLELGAQYGATAQVIEGDACAEGFPALYAVGTGSARGPRVAVLDWSGVPDGGVAPLVSLCGKGVCFDSGGYDLKPSAAMLRMKKDMGGAALMLGLAALIMDQRLPVRLQVWIGAVENMVSGNAMRPMDVLRTRAGMTVEVGNTDAEGRLVLCDLLTAAGEARPDLLLDAATLTGAARVALGPDLPALFAPHTPAGDRVADAILAAGATTHDPLWRLPLWAGYDPWLATPVAHFNTVSSKPMAGAIVAGLFLQRFVPPGIGWAHVDTYAWNDAGRPGRPEGGEALGLRALYSAIVELTNINLPKKSRVHVDV